MSSENTSWDGEERRSEDAEVKVGVAPLAMATRVVKEGLGVDQMFERHDDPVQNHVRPGDFEDPKLRSKVEALLRTAVVDDVEIDKYINGLVDSQYQGSLDTLKTFNLYNSEQPRKDDVPAPTLEQAKETLAKQLTPEQLEVINGMLRPTLQLIPITSMNRYVKALDSYKPIDNQEDAYVSPWHREAFERADKRDTGNNTIIGWRIAVTEGVKEPKILQGDNIKETLRDRNTRFEQKYGKKGVSGVDLKRMLLSMMDSLKTERPINDYCRDNGTWTFVNEEPEKSGDVSGVYWLDVIRRVDLNGFDADAQNSGARFRASVMVDVLFEF